ncbi:MAG: hypothetical protein OXI91_12905 [Chloroflexota bacterium]|nr:hypothetical protein [Chloroflexota bacterium]
MKENEETFTFVRYRAMAGVRRMRRDASDRRGSLGATAPAQQGAVIASDSGGWLVDRQHKPGAGTVS